MTFKLPSGEDSSFGTEGAAQAMHKGASCHGDLGALNDYVWPEFTVGVKGERG